VAHHMMWDARLHAVTYGLLWVFTETSGALHTGVVCVGNRKVVHVDFIVPRGRVVVV
jgi:hypothetical protein